MTSTCSCFLCNKEVDEKLVKRCTICVGDQREETVFACSTICQEKLTEIDHELCEQRCDERKRDSWLFIYNT